MSPPTRKATHFEIDTLKSVTSGQPVFLGHAAVISTKDDVQVIVITKTKGLLHEVGEIFAPGMPLNPQLIYPVAVIHRENVQLLSDDEEL